MIYAAFVHLLKIPQSYYNFYFQKLNSIIIPIDFLNKRLILYAISVHH